LLYLGMDTDVIKRHNTKEDVKIRKYSEAFCERGVCR